ncbi:Glycerol-3-phosphate 1-O-acyltransferase [Saliniradius amylolyticus]|uniref:Glycerol-3-phosphate acyltransferase n=1 Tax=Saliniradius amylolyticus TaxID=2183582 RepID=A0A2S2DYZ9_9ALTE|nr:glycerol-3-phosphate 1-O-acyltransferase PlsB [Saliniradius amylolyticus]AWL10579.1 Glycerol-3-phosphate 1-O-acyltransferase [Saliniradius amylolyticus]
MSWLQRFWLTLVSIPNRLLVRTKTIPADIEEELGIDPNRPVLYLLNTRSSSDLLALRNSCRDKGLTDPTDRVTLAAQTFPATVYLNKPQGLFSRKVAATDAANRFSELMNLQRQHPELDFQILPVSVFWGRAPGKTTSGWTELLADRAAPSWLRKLLIVLFLGRDNAVCFSRAVSSQRIAQDKGTDIQVAHKLIRVARTHFYRRSESMTGPRLISREQLQNAILGSPAVKAAIAEEHKGKKVSVDEARQRARSYLTEIAADYREGLIRLADRLLTRVWNKIYNGIEVHNAARVRELARKGHEIVYVPCHRSHMDYLLLTYVIYHEGLATPHIAAGINLNFWPVGGIFRRGGAFFLRRSFGGNKLYTAVFKEYLQFLFDRGYPVKYYPEGGRSRTGRLLPPKTGMLAMTLQGVLRGTRRPVTLVPVYIGYENVMELGSYLKELKGKNKQKESFGQVFSALRKLKNYGHGYLNFGDPVTLNSFLDEQVPQWRDTEDSDKKPSWMNPAVSALAQTMMHRINQAASVNGMALVSLCLLASEKRALTDKELTYSLEQFIDLLTQAPFSRDISLPEQDAAEVLEHVVSLNKLTVTHNEFGRVLALDDYNAIIHTYYRNNILHLFAVPGLIAAICIAHHGAERTTIMTLIEQLYPLLRRELSIYMDTGQAVEYAETMLKTLKQMGLLEQRGPKVFPASRTSNAYGALNILNQTIQPTLQRYALVLTLMEKHRNLSRNALEKESRRLAEHLSVVNGLNAPEFYDKNVLATFVNSLKEQELLAETDDGGYRHSAESSELQKQVLALIDPSVAVHLNELLQEA